MWISLPPQTDEPTQVLRCAGAIVVSPRTGALFVSCWPLTGGAKAAYLIQAPLTGSNLNRDYGTGYGLRLFQVPGALAISMTQFFKNINDRTEYRSSQQCHATVSAQAAFGQSESQRISIVSSIQPLSCPLEEE